MINKNHRMPLTTRQVPYAELEPGARYVIDGHVIIKSGHVGGEVLELVGCSTWVDAVVEEADDE